MRKTAGSVFLVSYVFLKNPTTLHAWCLNVTELHTGMAEMIIEYNFCFIKLDFLTHHFVWINCIMLSWSCTWKRNRWIKSEWEFYIEHVGLMKLSQIWLKNLGFAQFSFPSLFCFVLFFGGVGVGLFFQFKPHIQLKVLFQFTASVKSDKVDFLIDRVRSRISRKEVWKRHLWWWLHPYSCLLCSRFFECGHWYFLFGEGRGRGRIVSWILAQ